MSLLSLSLSLVRRSEEKRARAFLFLKLNFKKGLTHKRESEKYAKERDLRRKTRVLIRETTTGNNTVITEILRISLSLKKMRFFGWRRRDMHLLLLLLSLFCLSLSLRWRESIFFKRDERRLRAAARVERDWRFFFGD